MERQAILARLRQYVEDVDRLYSNIAQIERAWGENDAASTSHNDTVGSEEDHAEHQ